MVFTFHLIYILARISKHPSEVKVNILFCVHWVYVGVVLLAVAIETDAKMWQIYNALKNESSHTSSEEFRAGYLKSPKLPSALGTLQPQGLI